MLRRVKVVGMIAGCFLVGCLSPVSEGVDAGPCRASLGIADVHRDWVRLSATSGELRSGRYFFGVSILIDASSFEPIDGRRGGGPILWPCTNLMGSTWWHLPNASYQRVFVPKNGRDYVLLYEYGDQLQTQIDAACQADGGFGPTAVLIDRPAFNERGFLGRGAALSQTDAGFLACLVELNDAGVPEDMTLVRTDDSSLVSTLPSSADHCWDLRPPQAITGSNDGGRQLINFDTRRQVSTLPVGGSCRLTGDGAALCGVQSAATLVWGQGSTELAREEGAQFMPMSITLRDREFVRRISADGGYAWLWLRDGSLELLDEGMSASTIGDFDDHNIFYVFSRLTPDGGNDVEFERRCLPN